MEKKTITLSNKAFEIMHCLVCNDFADQAIEVAYENFDTPEEAEENIRAHAEILKAFGYCSDNDSMHSKAVILKMPCYAGNTLEGFYYFAEWKHYYEKYDDKSIELIKEITL